jgi:hypothetical protein
MGPVLSTVTKLFAGGSEIAPVDKGGGEGTKDLRRRNSMTFHISKFLTFEEDDYTPLLDMVKEEFETRLLAVASNSRDQSKRRDEVCDSIHAVQVYIC